MPNYAPRISLPFNDVSGVINMWSNSCDKMAVFQHVKDDKVKTTHVHVIMLDCKYKTQDTLCNQFRKLIDINIKGNKLWSWEHKDYPNPDISFIKYMTKGKLSPIFVKNISEEEIDYWRKQWQGKKEFKQVCQIETDNEVIPVRITQKTKWELLCIIDHEIKLYQQQYPHRVITKEIRNRIIVQVLKEEKQVIGLYKVQEFSYAYSLHFDTETFLDALNDSMKC